MVHRDIKPSNILVTADGRAKLVDMGLARLRMESEREDLTASGVTLGTFDYISPEQARDPRIADVRSDLYSLGCTFYFMLTGRPPFPEGTLLQKLLSHSSEPPADPRLIRPDLDEQIVRIIEKLLAKQPRDRYQQPNELIGELLLVADRLHLPGLNLTGAVWVGCDGPRWARVERILPWLVPFVLLFASVFALERLWSGSGVGTQGRAAAENQAAERYRVRKGSGQVRRSPWRNRRRPHPAGRPVAPPAESDFGRRSQAKPDAAAPPRRSLDQRRATPPAKTPAAPQTKRAAAAPASQAGRPSGPAIGRYQVRRRGRETRACRSCSCRRRWQSAGHGAHAGRGGRTPSRARGENSGRQSAGDADHRRGGGRSTARGCQSRGFVGHRLPGGRRVGRRND